jgi:hypothetical protein
MPRQIIRTFGLDRDTIAFAQRVRVGSGTTILPNNLIQLNKFVVGIKRMGLWNQMVCWPMRSTQNAGRGSTVYSLGGLGTFNGTMINGPTWGNTGVNFTKTSTQFISTTLNPNLTNNGVFVCSDWSQITALDLTPTAIATRDIFGNNGQRGSALGTTVANNVRAISSPDGATINSFQITTFPAGYACHSMLSNGSVLTINQNNTQVTTQTIVSGTAFSNLNIGAALGFQNTYKGIISFALAIYAPVNNTLLYTLYRQTLGQNLGLPV